MENRFFKEKEKEESISEIDIGKAVSFRSMSVSAVNPESKKSQSDDSVDAPPNTPEAIVVKPSSMCRIL